MDIRAEGTPGHEAPPMPQMNDDAFRRVVEYAPSAMVLVDGRGMMVLVNEQTERLFGYPRTELIGRSVDMLVPSAARAPRRLPSQLPVIAQSAPDGRWP